jgi:hypothetical protein
MRLSLMKAAHVALFGTAYRKYGYLPGFGRCGIPRTSTLDCARSEERWASGSIDSRETGDRQPWNPTSAKTGQIWGTHHSLPIEITPLATIGFLEVCEKSRLAGTFWGWGARVRVRA